MAFNDTPQIDKPSINSNTSEIELEKLFSQSAGFICRKDVPDKGCDYDIELITEATNISGWRFALQLKSIEKLNVISDGTYISYSFETSRLGYLMRRIPAMGIIALYSVEQNEIFFDYVDSIYNRLMDERDSDEWKQNDKVNIRVPIKNVLNSQSIQVIHQVFTNRFTQAARMQASHGKKYGLPTTNLAGNTRYDWNNIEDIKKMLLEYGLSLLNNYDLDIVFDLISQLSHKDICADRDLLRIAAVIYCEIGMYSEAQLYNTRFSQSGNMAPDEKLMVGYINLKISLGLGSITYKDFIEEAKSIAAIDPNEQNGIMLEINIIFYELLELKINVDITDGAFDKRIQIVFEKIRTSNAIPETMKIMLNIWNAENYGILINKINHNEFSTFKMQQSLGLPMSIESRKKAAIDTITRDIAYLSLIEELGKDIQKDGSILLDAYLQSTFGRYFLTKEIDCITFDITEPNDSHKTLLLGRIIQVFDSSKKFFALSHFKEAHTSLCDGLELLSISRDFYHYVDGLDKTSLLKEKEEMEKKLGIPQYNLTIPKLIALHKNNKEKNNLIDDRYSFLKNFSHEQIEWFAQIILRAMNLEIPRLLNIINELKAYKLFSIRCTNDNIMALQVFDRERTAANAYSEPTKFVLQSKVTGLTTHESDDMEELLQCWGM